MGKWQTKGAGKGKVAKGHVLKAPEPPAAVGKGKAKGKGARKGADQVTPPARLATPPWGQGGAAPAKGKGKGKAQPPQQQPWATAAAPQGKGGKAGAQAEEETPGFAGPRQRVGKKRHTGRISAWKGPYGWIVSDEEIDHPLANLRKGRIYLDALDVEKELSGVGAAVTFFLYSDDAGLGAAHVVPVKEGSEAVIKAVLPVKGEGKSGKKGKGEGKVVAPKGKGKDAQQGAAKGQGKAAQKGKAKGSAADEAGEKAEKVEKVFDKSTRTVVDEGPFTGTVQFWKGSVGWITPDDFAHDEIPTEGRHKGTLFAHKNDIEEGDVPMTNAIVIFSVHHNGRSLGAHSIQLVEQGDGVEKKPEGEDFVEVDGDGESKSKKKRNAKNKKGAAATDLKAVSQTLKAAQQLKQNGKGKGKGKDKGKGKKGKAETDGPTGPDLPRERVTTELVSGEVSIFKGRVGWIMPSEPIADSDSEKRGGKLFTFFKDVLDEVKLQQGDQVQFHVYKDAQGLGAEEVIKM